jgi:hypothetical protein
LACVLQEPSIERLLKRQEVDPREIERCLKRYCSESALSKDHQHAAHEETSMGDEIGKLRREIELLRSELSARAPVALPHLDRLLVAAPSAESTHPHMAESEMVHPHVDHAEAAHEDHHRHPLPFVIVDDKGKPTRVVRPASEKLMGRDPGPDPGDSGVGDDTHAGHDASATGHRRSDVGTKAPPKKK